MPIFRNRHFENYRFDKDYHGNLMKKSVHLKECDKCYDKNMVSDDPGRRGCQYVNYTSPDSIASDKYNPSELSSPKSRS